MIVQEICLYGVRLIRQSCARRCWLD